MTGRLPMHSVRSTPTMRISTRLEAGLRENDRHAVSEYVQMVLDRSPYPSRFPAQRSAGYVPESSLLAVEWYLPPVDVVPKYKAFRHIKTRKVVEPTARPVAEIRQIYQSVIAQIALRTLREIFDSTPEEMISTVVFNGRVHAVDPLTGQKIQPHLITLRATREQFTPLVLDEPKFNPVECVRRYFFADISPHPDELIPVEPVMPFSMADPRIVDPIDVISDIDKRPNLLELSPKEFEAFIQNLFTKMGFDYQAVPGQRRRRHRLRRLRSPPHHWREVHRPGQAIHPHRPANPRT